MLEVTLQLLEFSLILASTGVVVCGSETPVSSTGTKYSPLACSADPEIDSMARKVAELLEVTGIDLEVKLRLTCYFYQ